MDAPTPFGHDNNPFPAVFLISLQCEKSRIEIQSRLFVILLIMICDYFTFTFFTTLYVPVVLPDTACTLTKYFFFDLSFLIVRLVLFVVFVVND